MYFDITMNQAAAQNLNFYDLGRKVRAPQGMMPGNSRVCHLFVRKKMTEQTAPQKIYRPYDMGKGEKAG